VKTAWVNKETFLITLAGPAQTILTGTLGAILLFLYRKDYEKAEKLSLKQWLIIFIALFWLRQTANFLLAIVKYTLTGQHPTRSDEYEIAEYLHISYLSTSGITAFIGLAILALILFRFIPSKDRITFCLAGLTGGAMGYILWFKFLGIWIMP